jgi:hypothetical protein
MTRQRAQQIAKASGCPGRGWRLSGLVSGCALGCASGDRVASFWASAAGLRVACIKSFRKPNVHGRLNPVRGC